MWFLLSMAFAQDATQSWDKRWYGRPRANARAISVNGVTAAQAMVGGEVGLRYTRAPILSKGKRKIRGTPNLLGRTRLQADVLYGLTSGSLGYGVRLGSFIGPTSQFVTYQVGPDLWGNAYGAPDAVDYHLPFSMGLDIPSTVIFHIDRSVNAQVAIIPGWAFSKSRQVGNIGPFHELTGMATVSARMGSFGFVVGYQRTYNAAGVTDGLILSAGL